MSETEKVKLNRRDFLALSTYSLGALTLNGSNLPLSERAETSKPFDIVPEKEARFSTWPMDGTPEELLGNGTYAPTGYLHLQATVNKDLIPDGGHHLGTDFNLGKGYEDYGANIRMIMDGVCVFADEDRWSGLGKIAIFCVKLPGGKLIYPRYAHLKEWSVVPGESYKTGDIIAFCGRSGYLNRASHLHLDIATREGFEQLYSGENANPWSYPYREPLDYLQSLYANPVDIIEKFLPEKFFENHRRFTAMRERFKYDF